MLLHGCYFVSVVVVINVRTKLLMHACVDHFKCVLSGSHLNVSLYTAGYLVNSFIKSQPNQIKYIIHSFS